MHCLLLSALFLSLGGYLFGEAESYACAPGSAFSLVSGKCLRHAFTVGVESQPLFCGTEQPQESPLTTPLVFSGTAFLSYSGTKTDSSAHSCW